MGKFDGVLIASDYDNTMAYTEGALRSGGELPTLSEANRRAIEYFMAEGGVFSVATGRALPAFAPIAPTIPMNGPTILFNGAAIYDFFQQRYLSTAFMPESVRGLVQPLLDEFPEAAVEVYHDDNSIHSIHANEITRRHLHLTHMPTVAMEDMYALPSPLSKVLFEAPEDVMPRLVERILSQDWSRDYEVVPSAPMLLELTAHGANKGGMIERLAAIVNVPRRHVYCAGDHANDIPMLRFAHIPFAPANAIEPVRRLEGVRVLPHCRDDAIAAMIDQLDQLY